MKTLINISSIEKKVSKTGKNYYSFKSDIGNVSCFEPKVAEQMLDKIGKSIEVELEERDSGWKNITKFYGLASAVEETKLQTGPKPSIATPLTLEKDIKIKIWSTAKGLKNFDVVISANTIEEARSLLGQSIELAQEACLSLNQPLKAEPEEPEEPNGSSSGEVA